VTVTAGLRRWKQEDCEFKSIVGYTARLASKTNKETYTEQVTKSAYSGIPSYFK
jgi:hypothetical protein